MSLTANSPEPSKSHSTFTMVPVPGGTSMSAANAASFPDRDLGSRRTVHGEVDRRLQAFAL